MVPLSGREGTQVSTPIAVRFAACMLFNASFDARGADYLVNADGSGDFPTIRDAVGASIGGDTITLGNGVFTGSDNRNIWGGGRNLLIRSAAGNPDSCVIDLQGLG